MTDPMGGQARPRRVVVGLDFGGWQRRWVASLGSVMLSCWVEEAACATSPGGWHPEPGQDATRELAICRACPVQQPCLAYALQAGEPDGIWGGFTTEGTRSSPRRPARVRGVSTAAWSGQVQAEVAARLAHPGLGRWLGQVQQVRSCSHPVRLVGATDTIDTATGEVLTSYSSESEPDGVTYVRCGNRRQAVCPSCSHEYKGDVWHVLMAGAAGGMKDVPVGVAAHPLVFATFTAPSFGLVHAAKKPGRPGSRRCLPRVR